MLRISGSSSVLAIRVTRIPNGKIGCEISTSQSLSSEAMIVIFRAFQLVEDTRDSAADDRRSANRVLHPSSTGVCDEGSSIGFDCATASVMKQTNRRRRAVIVQVRVLCA